MPGTVERPTPVFGADPHGAGRFDDWIFHHGHRIPRHRRQRYCTIWKCPARRAIISPPAATDLAIFRQPELADAVCEGRVLVSTGAFADTARRQRRMGDTVTDPDGQPST